MVVEMDFLSGGVSKPKELVLFDNGEVGEFPYSYSNLTSSPSFRDGYIYGKVKNGVEGYIGFTVDLTDWNSIVFEYAGGEAYVRMTLKDSSGNNIDAMSTDVFNRRCAFDVSNLSGNHTFGVCASNGRVIYLKYLKVSEQCL